MDKYLLKNTRDWNEFRKMHDGITLSGKPLEFPCVAVTYFTNIPGNGFVYTFVYFSEFNEKSA